jgi:undecaprenyl-diphosphatase
LVVALWLASAALLLAMAFTIHAHPLITFPGDVGLLALVQRSHQPLLVRFINFASDANWPFPAGLTVLQVTLFLLVARRDCAAVCALVAGFLADFASFFLLNDWVRHPRPHDVHIHAVGGIGATSFPSGHVAHVTAFYGFLLYLSIQELRAHPDLGWRLRIVQAICVYFIAFIGISRLLRDEHWPSDVFASYILGAMMLLVAIALDRGLGALWPRRAEPPRELFGELLMRLRRQLGCWHGSPAHRSRRI